METDAVIEAREIASGLESGEMTVDVAKTRIGRWNEGRVHASGFVYSKGIYGNDERGLRIGVESGSDRIDFEYNLKKERIYQQKVAADKRFPGTVKRARNLASRLDSGRMNIESVSNLANRWNEKSRKLGCDEVVEGVLYWESAKGIYSNKDLGVVIRATTRGKIDIERERLKTLSSI